MVLFDARTTEAEMALKVMEIAAERPDGYVTLNELREEIPHRIKLTRGDMQQSETRPGEPMWHQILRNIKSHSENEKNAIRMGYLDYIKGGAYRITEKGREALRRYEDL